MSEPDVVEILRSAAIFAELPDDALARLAARCVRRTYGRNQFLWYQGDDGAHLVVVASGLVKVVLSSPQGGEVVLTTLGPGGISGELAVLDGSPRSASVVAAEPTTVLLLTRATVLDMLNRYPSVLDALLRSLGNLIRRITEQAGDFVFLDLGGRVAKLLLHLAEAHGARLYRPRPPPHAIRPRGDGRRHPPGGQPRAAEPRGPRCDRSGRTADRAGEPRGAAPEGVRLSSGPSPKGELTHVFETAWTSAVNLRSRDRCAPGWCRLFPTQPRPG